MRESSSLLFGLFRLLSPGKGAPAACRKGLTPVCLCARRDLARFIAAGRLTCTIDRVNGVVETHRPDAKNARYAAVIKQGDAVLTSVQRLSRVIG